MTTVYFIRHAESDHSVHDDQTRPLTENGLAASRMVTEFLRDKNIDVILSSPYKRAVDTIVDFAYKSGLDILMEESFKERKNGKWLDDGFFRYIKRQWDDFSYKLDGGESFEDVQKRNIAALNGVLVRHSDKNIVIGTHGMALSTIINYYDRSYGFDDFMGMVNIVPWVVKMTFDGQNCAGMEKIDLFNRNMVTDYEHCKVFMSETGTLKAYHFVVVFSRYKDKWLYCRAKVRDSYETAGGHIEQGETPLEAAKRELYEETGAVEFDISPVFDYSVHTNTGYSNGQVFLACIKTLGKLPDYEMENIELFDSIPSKMRFPQILPVLFEKIKEL